MCLGWYDEQSSELRFPQEESRACGLDRQQALACGWRKDAFCALWAPISVLLIRCVNFRANKCSVPRHQRNLQDKSSGFQDNDSLAKELARELNADLLVLLTNVDGLMDGPPKDRNSK
jgi:hypothetical protein